jgi:hypothetical protein
MRLNSEGDGPQEEANPELREAVLEVVENQIRDGDPPETAATLERLLRAGHRREEALRLIGSVVVVELYHMLGTKTPFNRERFVSGLAALPKLPPE